MNRYMLELNNDSKGLRRYYVKNQKLEFDEDLLHEFKGHRNITLDNVPCWAILANNRPSRRPASRTINGYLNSGLGGTIYLGVTDDGMPTGMSMNRNQREHIYIQLCAMFEEKFKPSVPHSRWRVGFIPTVDPSRSHEHIMEIYDKELLQEPLHEEKKHTIEGSTNCWCDREQLAMKAGSLIHDYIVEVEVKPWEAHPDPDDEDDFDGVQTFHKNEEDKYFIRDHGHNMELGFEEMLQMINDKVEVHYLPIIHNLQAEISQEEKKKKAQESQG